MLFQICASHALPSKFLTAGSVFLFAIYESPLQCIFLQSRAVGAIHELPLQYDFGFRGTHEGGSTLRMPLQYIIYMFITFLQAQSTV